MEITKEYIDSYFERLFKKRKLISSVIEKNPIIGVDISKLDRKQKLYLGGIRKLAIEIDNEILSVYEFLEQLLYKTQPPFIISRNIKEAVDEIKSKQIQLLDFKGDEVVFHKDVDTILKDIK